MRSVVTGGAMSTVYNPEADVIAQIERLELEIRDVRRRIEHAHSEADKRVLNKQIDEMKQEIQFLQKRVD
jgi:predicted  nucleic acid-binding Zn-ribbon protein